MTVIQFIFTSAPMTQKKYKIDNIRHELRLGASRNFWAQISTKWGKHTKNAGENMTIEAPTFLSTDQSHESEFIPNVIIGSNWSPKGQVRCTSAGVCASFMEQKGICMHKGWFVWKGLYSASLMPVNRLEKKPKKLNKKTIVLEHGWTKVDSKHVPKGSLKKNYWKFQVGSWG